jgi:L-seryl-tRNA(Ser) seleniumtransferase
MTLAALEATLRAYLDEARAMREIPTLRMLTMPLEESRSRANELAAGVRDAVGGAADVAVVDDIARAGGGALPVTDIPTAVVSVAPAGMSASKLETLLRCGAEPAIIARVKDDRLLIDPRTLVDAEERDIVVRRLGELLGTR